MGVMFPPCGAGPEGHMIKEGCFCVPGLEKGHCSDLTVLHDPEKPVPCSLFFNFLHFPVVFHVVYV